MYILRPSGVTTALMDKQWSGPVAYAAAAKEALGKYPCEELTFWGHAHIQAHHLQLDLTQCEVEVQSTKIVIGNQMMVMFRIVCDAGNPTYGGLLDDGEWEPLPDLRHGKNETREICWSF